MYLSGLLFLLAFIAIFILVAAFRGTQQGLYFLIPAGIVLLVMSSMMFTSGLEIQSGQTITNETADKTVESYDYKQILSQNQTTWLGLIMALSSVFLILMGVSGRFM